MTNNQWDDDKLEKLLHSMPKIEDNRSKEQVLENLKKDQRLKKTASDESEEMDACHCCGGCTASSQFTCPFDAQK